MPPLSNVFHYDIVSFKIVIYDFSLFCGLSLLTTHIVKPLPYLSQTFMSAVLQYLFTRRYPYTESSSLVLLLLLLVLVLLFKR